MSDRKTSAQRSVQLVPQAHGGALQRGNPGNKGGGRKPEKFYEHCLDAIEDPLLWQQAREKQPLQTLGLAAEYLVGKPTQAVQHSGDVTFRVVYDEETAPDREDA